LKGPIYAHFSEINRAPLQLDDESEKFLESDAVVLTIENNWKSLAEKSGFLLKRTIRKNIAWTGTKMIAEGLQ